ncbi:hypothetical protein M099_2277 [Phocaeicola vulgatus str. 3975 RP4]|uniref:Uncharacterized protein n=3 Tax=root TaxID=1 RepID=A0A078RFL7_PHOVU|nr:hypothetical protein M098_1229 [Phocaeicola vulgatus str. 3775 SR(B) 19]KDS33521.1 hypothetical protein M097_0686 [Phocaeicola vulgatus str. 3775 SL(B) 10 (iv)]KDS53852.1 hypothetical protein M099_2277 [Phocaeicola vulgatus str. 3975 RP4]DAE67264.1 MAG TPA: hypothetical protein [Caudoviricetes sp.]DAF59798.1 MAG TPA: hypothetical protein [Siphoviridae sp. ct47y1]
MVVFVVDLLLADMNISFSSRIFGIFLLSCFCRTDIDNAG